MATLAVRSDWGESPPLEGEVVSPAPGVDTALCKRTPLVCVWGGCYIDSNTTQGYDGYTLYHVAQDDTTFVTKHLLISIIYKNPNGEFHWN